MDRKNDNPLTQALRNLMEGAAGALRATPGFVGSAINEALVESPRRAINASNTYRDPYSSEAEKVQAAGDIFGAAAEWGAAGLAVPRPANSIGSFGRVKNPIRAYHGSPHDFDRFDVSKIGTGEGAQAYGHGLYFAEKEGVAREYKEALKMKGYDNNPMYAEAVANHGFGAREFDQFESLARTTIHDPDLLAREFFNFNDEWRPLADNPVEFKNVRDFAEKYIASMPEGRMYEVNIHANPDDFLDWDRPLSGPPDKTRLAPIADEMELVADNDYGLYQKRDTVQRYIDKYRENPADPRVRRQLDNYMRSAARDWGLDAIEKKFNKTQGESYRELEGEIGAALASKQYREMGYPGVRYLDAGSRFDGEGTRNYVVFDDSIIEIVRKYGIPAAISAGVISETMAPQIEAQIANQDLATEPPWPTQDIPDDQQIVRFGPKPPWQKSE